MDVPLRSDGDLSFAGAVRLLVQLRYYSLVSEVDHFRVAAYNQTR